MRNLILAFLLIPLLLGCQSNEKKALSLVKDYMYKNLHDYKSYEPIETKIDSLFSEAETNDDVLQAVKKFEDEADRYDKESEEYSHALDLLQIWSGGWSSTSRSKFKQYQKEATEHLSESIKALLAQNECSLLIKDIADTIKRDFIGWKITHSFRSNNLAGHSSKGDYVFWADKKFKNIIRTFDNEEYMKQLSYALLIWTIENDDRANIVDRIETVKRQNRQIDSMLNALNN